MLEVLNQNRIVNQRSLNINFQHGIKFVELLLIIRGWLKQARFVDMLYLKRFRLKENVEKSHFSCRFDFWYTKTVKIGHFASFHLFLPVFTSKIKSNTKFYRFYQFLPNLICIYHYGCSVPALS